MKEVKISFLGDIALVGKYNEIYKAGTDPFSEISPILTTSDFVIGNLECLSKGEDGENIKKKPRLKTNTDSLHLLSNLKMGMVTLAHNHIYDNLKDGFKKTTEFLKHNKIEFIGAGFSKGEAAEPFIYEQYGIRFCFLNYVTNDTNPNLPRNATITPNFYQLGKIENDIKEYRSKVDQIVVLLHWGGRLENGYFPDFNQPKEAKKMIDYGADLIVGHHSHTLQPYEIYNGKYIFYSLGNFCFVDFKSDGETRKIKKGRRTNSIILDVNFKKDKYTVDFKYIKNNEGFIINNPSYKYYYQIRQYIFMLIRNIKPLWLIYFFNVKIVYRGIRVIKRKFKRI